MSLAIDSPTVSLSNHQMPVVESSNAPYGIVELLYRRMPAVVELASTWYQLVCMSRFVMLLAAPTHVHFCVQEVRAQSPEQTISTQDSIPLE